MLCAANSVNRVRHIAGTLLSVGAALVLLTGCPSPTEEGTKPPARAGQPPAGSGRELGGTSNQLSQSNEAMARLIGENVDRQRKAIPPQVHVLFDCDFEKAETNKVPEDFLVLDGAFAVQEEKSNRFLELPGAPLDSFGVLFGPTCSNNISLCARIFGTARGRREPVFGVSLGGAGGLKLMVAPGKRVIELGRGDDSLARTPYTWETGKWTWMRLHIRPLGPDEWLAEGKAWREGTPEPPAWQVTYREKSEPSPGRPGVWGSPISGTPIRFDDFRLTTP